MVAKKSKVSVATYLGQQIAMSGKSLKEIAEHVGYTNSNVLTMMKQGHTKVPVGKVKLIAEALGIDPIALLRVVMAEYQPETWEMIEGLVGGDKLVSGHEASLLEIYRESTGGIPIELEVDENRRGLQEAFKQLSRRDQAKAKASLSSYDAKPRNAKHK